MKSSPPQKRARTNDSLAQLHLAGGSSLKVTNSLEQLHLTGQLGMTTIPQKWISSHQPAMTMTAAAFFWIHQVNLYLTTFWLIPLTRALQFYSVPSHYKLILNAAVVYNNNRCWNNESNLTNMNLTLFNIVYCSEDQKSVFFQELLGVLFYSHSSELISCSSKFFPSLMKLKSCNHLKVWLKYSFFYWKTYGREYLKKNNPYF